ncbi:hypothetical protein R6Q59_035699 [Mikania micrantha]|uniref:Sulfite reductase [NADPH] flavoprotein alpha-component-like FAD-binding domain-containing protein n=1 Tax=Mikania micrantha TaxID=192012 RepID=A0A5N6LAA9_9ASTR|nr:hypothetical protein E3N88_45031 [Mikania micrantha]
MKNCVKHDFKSCFFKKELVWPELDLLLRDEDGKAAATPYTTAIPDYRVTFHDKPDVFSKDHSQTNVHAVCDAQHPCRYETRDHVGVYCENLVEVLEEAERLMGLPSNTYFSIHTENEDGTPLGGPSLQPHFPPCTSRKELTNYADLLSSPKKVN